MPRLLYSFSFFFNATATTDIYTLSLHDALPISDYKMTQRYAHLAPEHKAAAVARLVANDLEAAPRSEEHTSELQSLRHLVCRLLLEKKKKKEKMQKKDKK